MLGPPTLLYCLLLRGCMFLASFSEGMLCGMNLIGSRQWYGMLRPVVYAVTPVLTHMLPGRLHFSSVKQLIHITTDGASSGWDSNM